MCPHHSLVNITKLARTEEASYPVSVDEASQKNTKDILNKIYILYTSGDLTQLNFSIALVFLGPQAVHRAPPHLLLG